MTAAEPPAIGRLLRRSGQGHDYICLPEQETVARVDADDFIAAEAARLMGSPLLPT